MNNNNSIIAGATVEQAAEYRRIAATRFSLYVNGAVKGSDAFNEARRVHRFAEKFVAAMNAEGAEVSKGRLSVSLSNPDKHRSITVSTLREDSLANKVAESERMTKLQAFTTARNEGLPSYESGLSDDDYIKFAKQLHIIPRSAKEENASGNWVFTAAGCKRWLTAENAAAVASRRVTLPSPDNVTEFPTAETAAPVSKSKRKQA